MKSKGTTKHRGEILQAAVAKSGMSITALAKKTGFSRGSYYNHIMDPELPYDILLEYGKAMKHDFTPQLPHINKHSFEEDSDDYTVPTDLEQAIKQAERWRTRYYLLLEKYNQLLEELRK